MVSEGMTQILMKIVLLIVVTICGGSDNLVNANPRLGTGSPATTV